MCRGVVAGKLFYTRSPATVAETGTCVHSGTASVLQMDPRDALPRLLSPITTFPLLLLRRPRPGPSDFDLCSDPNLVLSVKVA